MSATLEDLLLEIRQISRQHSRRLGELEDSMEDLLKMQRTLLRRISESTENETLYHDAAESQETLHESDASIADAWRSRRGTQIIDESEDEAAMKTPTTPSNKARTVAAVNIPSRDYQKRSSRGKASPLEALNGKGSDAHVGKERAMTPPSDEQARSQRPQRTRNPPARQPGFVAWRDVGPEALSKGKRT